MATVSRTQAIQAFKTDYNYMMRTLKPDEVVSDFPDLFVAIFNLITQNIDKPEIWERYVIGIPRGHAKTTFLEGIVVWVITFSTLQAFMIVCATEELAEDILSDICDMLSMPDYIRLFGNWETNKIRSTNSLKEFHFLGRLIRLDAKGAGSKVRGKLRVSRPQFYLLDDIQQKEDADSPTKFKKLYSWLLTTLLKGKHPKRALALYCGNKYPTKYCLLSALEAHPKWASVVLGSLLSDGEALWEEVRSKESLLQEFQDDIDAGMPEAFVSEMLNGKTEGLGGGLRIDKIPQYERPASPLVGRFLLIDIATDKETLDQCVIAGQDLHADDTVVTTSITEGKWAHDDLAVEAVNIALSTNTPHIIYEDVQFQHIMGKELRKEVARRGILGLQISPISPRGMAKNRRIRDYFFKMLMKGIIRLHPSVRAKVIDQISTFDYTTTNNLDDILDAEGYAYLVTQDPELRMKCILPVNDILLEEDEDLVVHGHTSF